MAFRWLIQWSILQLRDRLPSLWTEVRLKVTLLCYKLCCFRLMKYNFTILGTAIQIFKEGKVTNLAIWLVLSTLWVHGQYSPDLKYRLLTLLPEGVTSNSRLLQSTGLRTVCATTRACTGFKSDKQTLRKNVRRPFPSAFIVHPSNPSMKKRVTGSVWSVKIHSLNFYDKHYFTASTDGKHCSKMDQITSTTYLVKCSF